VGTGFSIKLHGKIKKVLPEKHVPAKAGMGTGFPTKLHGKSKR